MQPEPFGNNRCPAWQIPRPACNPELLPRRVLCPADPTDDSHVWIAQDEPATYKGYRGATRHGRQYRQATSYNKHQEDAQYEREYRRDTRYDKEETHHKKYHKGETSYDEEDKGEAPYKTLKGEAPYDADYKPNTDYNEDHKGYGEGHYKKPRSCGPIKGRLCSKDCAQAKGGPTGLTQLWVVTMSHAEPPNCRRESVHLGSGCGSSHRLQSNGLIMIMSRTLPCVYLRRSSSPPTVCQTRLG